MSGIEWRPVVGYEGLYEVSSDGQVLSLPRADSWGRLRPGRTLRPVIASTGYPQVGLSRNGKARSRLIHQLVLEAFTGPRPDGMEVRHLDDNKLNNQLANLVYGTSSENKFDRVANGIHHNAVKTHCPQDHPYEGENLIIRADGWRECRACSYERSRERKRRQRALEAAIAGMGGAE